MKSRRISGSRTGKWRELAQKTPECGDRQHGKIECRERLGGLLRYYYRDAA